MSDIFVKTSGLGSTGWRKASNLWVKTAGLGSVGWRSAVGVWIRNSTQWLKVWPLSGIFATRVPYIGYFSSDAYEDRMPNATYGTIRIGDSYFGDNARWDLNSWTASSYTYRWKLYDQYGSDLSITLRSGTGSGWTSTTGEDQLPTSVWTSTNSTNADNQFLGFEVTANNSSNSQYNGLSVSTKIKVIRERPVNLTKSLSTNSPSVGTSITYSSTWQTGEAYKAESARTSIRWYNNSTSSTSGGTLATGTGSTTATYTPDANDSGKYLYAVETRYNSGTDYDLGIATGIEASAVTTGVVGSTPSAFTYSLANASSVTTPSAPVQQRVSATSNTVLIEMASAFPSDTESYELLSYGTGSSAGGTLATPSVQSITTLNQYNSSGNFVTTGGSFDTITSISSSASNSPISTFTKAIGKSRSIQVNASTTSGAQSWAISWNLSGASGGNGTYISNTDSMPLTITVGGVSNPTISINSVTAYSGLGQTGATRAGTAGSQTSLSSITKPTAVSTTSSTNYTFYSNLQVTGSQRRVTLPAVFNSGTTIYVSTNGYINWGGSGLGADPSGSLSIPSLDSSGITVAPLNGDLRQGAVSASGTTSTGGLWVFADTTNYWVTWWGNYYNDAAQVARYQVKFYWGQSYADVYIVNNSLTTITPSTTAVQNNQNVSQLWSATTAQTSTLLSTASMNRISTHDGIDDNRTAIVASVPDIIPTITIGINSGVSQTGGTINWTSTNQASFSSTGTFSGTGTTGTSISKTGLTAGTTYTGTVTVTSSTGNTASANYSLTTSANLTWTVTWDAAGGTGGGSTTENRGVAHTAPSPGTRTGFDFQHYRYPASGGTDPVFVASGGSYNPTAATTFGAIWTAKTYSVTFNANGGTGAPATQTKTHGTNLTLSSSTPTRSGYTFNGWNTLANGTGTNYSAGGSYTTDAALALFAKWTLNATTYTVSYSANGGAATPAVPASQVTTGTVTVATRPNFTRTNCTLGAGWNTNSSGTGTDYANGSSLTVSADTTLFAKWTANAVTFTLPTVTFTGTSGSGSTTQRSWSWTAGSVSGGTATGYQWAISSTSATSGFGSFSATTTATTLTVTASSARWLKVRKVATNGLGATVTSGTRDGV
jgi:uncharacterized repeat protein (TIGR02543 family)